MTLPGAASFKTSDRAAQAAGQNAGHPSSWELAIELLFEFLLQLVLEIIGQILFELLTAFGWESVSVGRDRKPSPVLAGTRHFLLGVCAGVVSVLIVGRRLTPHYPLPGLSLVLSPIGTGIAMHWIGEFWRERGRERPALFTFGAGALFAFGMALVRFVGLELKWSPL